VRITKHFTREELQCKCGCEGMKFSSKGVEVLEELREDFGHSIVINSGYRCPEHNNKVSSTGLTGPHTITKSDNITVDIKIMGVLAERLMATAVRQGKWTGFGFKQNGLGSGRFIHLDRLAVSETRPRIWTY